LEQNKEITSNETNFQPTGIFLLESALHNSKLFLTWYSVRGILSDRILFRYFSKGYIAVFIGETIILRGAFSLWILGRS